SLVAAVEFVAHDGVAHRREVNPNLMLPTGLERARDEGIWRGGATLFARAHSNSPAAHRATSEGWQAGAFFGASHFDAQRAVGVLLERKAHVEGVGLWKAMGNGEVDLVDSAR